MWALNTCGEPNEIELAAAHGLSYRPLLQALAVANKSPIYSKVGKYEYTRLKYTGLPGVKVDGLCDGSSPLDVTIDLTCDLSATTQAAVRPKVGVMQDCALQLEVPSANACAEDINWKECVATDVETGYQYDLSALRRADSDWAAGGTTSAGKYDINVCRSLVGAGPGAAKTHDKCAGHTVCREDRSGGFQGIGESSSPTVVDGRLVVGSDAGTGGCKAQIIFTCGDRVGTPVLISDSDDCTRPEPFNSTPMAANSISSSSPHVRCTPMWALSTRGEPDETKKNTHPNNIYPLFRAQATCTSRGPPRPPAPSATKSLSPARTAPRRRRRGTAPWSTQAPTSGT